MVRSGDKIVELREKNAMTQEELASKIGISRASHSHYEKNRRTPDYSILTNLADYFRVSVDYLLGRSDVLSGGPGASKQLIPSADCFCPCRTRYAVIKSFSSKAHSVIGYPDKIKLFLTVTFSSAHAYVCFVWNS